MNIQLLSDLHLERQPDFLPPANPAADVLVLAGDIGSYQEGSQLCDTEFGLDRFSPRHPDCPWRKVLFVPGNHEYDGLDFDATHDRLRATCERLGITWLEREAVELDGVRFVGTTLWSDFDAIAMRGSPPVTRDGTPSPSPLTWRMQQREKAFRAANHYLKTNSTLRSGRRMLAEDLRELALDCQSWLRATLAQPFTGPTVVVTHFAPSLRSHDPRFGLTPGTAGFCNGLDDLLPAADLWLHGHLHSPSEYTVHGAEARGPWGCRVVANPLGYAERREQQGFRPELLIEVPGLAKCAYDTQPPQPVSSTE